VHLPPAKDSFKKSELLCNGYAVTFRCIFLLLLFFGIPQVA